MNTVPRFYIGDRVRVREFREEYANQPPSFVREMRQFCGAEFVIEDMWGEHARYMGYSWHEDWLDLVFEEEEEAEADVDPAAFEAIIHSLMRG